MWRMSNSVNLPHFKYASFFILEKYACVVVSRIDLYYQWWIRDFPDGAGGGAPTPEFGPKTLFDEICRNCMKMKEIGLRGARISCTPPLDPPMIMLPYY